jgi:hypothetical protein
MIYSIESLLNNLKSKTIMFVDVIATIDGLYQYTPTSFRNGSIFNDANQNQGSAKVFSLAQMHQLSVEETLILFAEHYQSVLGTPEGNDHQNIRQFIQNGWDGIEFENQALSSK